MVTTSAGPMICARDVRVDYDDVTAVNQLNFSVAAGEVYGLIGPNGAGKTSTIRVLATLLEPTYGEVSIAGWDTTTHPAAARAALGYMPDLAPVFDELKVWELLDVFARAYGLRRRSHRRERIEQVLTAVSLTGKRNAMAGTLSRGMTQRLVLAKTLLHRPAVLLLDEPASGLDPIARIELRDLLRALARDGHTVMISSHILTEMADFCTSIGIMEKGRLVLDGPLAELTARLKPAAQVTVELTDAAGPHVTTVQEVIGFEDVTVQGQRMVFTFADDDAERAQLLATLVKRGLPIKAFYSKAFGVEDLMLQVGARETS